MRGKRLTKMFKQDDQPIIILPSWLVTSALEPPNERWGVRISAGRISYIGPHQELTGQFPTDIVIEANGQALFPGFVNAHTHLYGILAHGIPLHKAPSDFWGFLNDFWWPLVENRLDQEMINAATAMRCAHMLQSGVTTFYDCTEAPNALPGCLESQSYIVNQLGLRAVLSFEATERLSAANGELGLRENVDFIKHCNKRREADSNFLISGLMCHHTLFTCSPQFIQKGFELAVENKTLLHAHVSEGTYEPEYALNRFGKRPLHVYEDLGITGDRFLASQCVQISPSEIELIARSGVRVAHMPLSNCEVGGGIAPIPELTQQKITLGLGSDGYIDDFFEIMRGAFLIHKAFKLDPRVMPAQTVWYLATEGGARALGLHEIGRIEEGWAADLQLIDCSMPTPLEKHNFYEQMLLYRNKTHVRSVLVNGQYRIKDGQITGSDVEQLRANVHQQARRLWADV